MYPRKLTKAVICRPDYPVAEVSGGRLRGLVVEDTFIFRGIKYADARRFEMPCPVKPWKGIRDARTYGCASPEIHTGITFDAYNVPHFYVPQDESCQYLNIWTQCLDDNAKRPVMVWIHGGGFSTGSSVELFAYDGEELSKYGNVVVVSLNHRLNVLGYLDLSEYGEKYKYSGNLGSADLVAALQWIQRNIQNFGGDPDNVTIMGQSGGGGKVAALLQTPAADGLYHKAIIQSGILPDKEDISQTVSRDFAAKVTDKLGLTKKNIEKIETIPYFELARAAAEITGSERVPCGPVTDYQYYFGSALATGFRDETLHIPILIGSVLGEFNNNFNFPIGELHKSEWDEKMTLSFLREKYKADTEKIIDLFHKAYPNRVLADVLFLDAAFRKGSIMYSEARTKENGGAVYNWLFNLECPVDGGTLPWHNAEEAYMFHNAKYLEASYIPGVSERLQDQMCKAWVMFAETGNPNHEGIPYWSAYQEKNGTTMIFDTTVYSVCHHDAALIEALLAGKKEKHFSPNAYRLGGAPRQSL